MSKVLVIQCDHKDGECLEEFNGFNHEATEEHQLKYLKEIGWLAKRDEWDLKHYCPKHAKANQ